MGNVFANKFISKFLEIFGSFVKKRTDIMKNLAVFDFDHTIIDDNSDTAVMKLIEKSKFPPELKELNKAEGWTSFMQGVFEILHKNNISEPDIAQLIKNIPEVDGIKNLIVELHDAMDYDVVIISDSNTYFINLWLEENNLASKVLKVFSNPAHFDEQGRLTINMYHVQDSCKLSTRNLCKGMIMEDFIKAQSEKGTLYDKIAYIGDGHNDFCPMLRLNGKGIACCRNKYKCVDLVKKVKGGENISEKDGTKTKYTMNAELCVWERGHDILDFLKK